MELIESSDRWELPIIGREVTRCLIDYAFGIELWSVENPIVVRISRRVILRTHESEMAFCPDIEQTELGPLLCVLHKSVVSAVAMKDGTLLVEFSDGLSLKVPPDDKYEAWELDSKDGGIVVCLPGGGLSIWLGDEGMSFGVK